MPPSKRKAHAAKTLPGARETRIKRRAAVDNGLDNGEDIAMSFAEEMETEEMHAGASSSSSAPTGGSSAPLRQGRLYNVGDMEVFGVCNDPVGLVGSIVIVPWEGSASRCMVDAYAGESPGGPAYVISWHSKRCREEYHLFSVGKMAERGAQCSRDVKAKLNSTRQARQPRRFGTI